MIDLEALFRISYGLYVVSSGNKNQIFLKSITKILLSWQNH